MSRTKKRYPEKVQQLLIERVEGMWVAPAFALEEAEKAFNEATVGQLPAAIDAFLSSYQEGIRLLKTEQGPT
jgi:hypothetical protein